MWAQKLSSVPIWARPYFFQFRSNTIQLIPAIVFGNRRSLHLYQRCSIEDVLRYFYFFDHKIEHILMQRNPTCYPTFSELVDWIKKYPTLVKYKEKISENCGNLVTCYKELSRTVHGTTLGDLQLCKDLISLNVPITDIEKERKMIRTVYRSLFLLLTLFHIEEVPKFSLDEKKILFQLLTPSQKRLIAGLWNSTI